MSVELTSRDQVQILKLGDGENRFSLEWLARVEEALDQVEQAVPTALVTMGTGKFYSNGLDVSQFENGPDALNEYVARVEQLFARVLSLGVPTVAAINGHAFGAGAMLAIAHDYRVQNNHRGYFCFPEVDIHIPFTTGMSALIQSKLTPTAAVHSMTTGIRFSGDQSVATGLVDVSVAPDSVLDTAVDFVAPLANKNADTLSLIKETMFAETLAKLRVAASDR